MSTNDILTRMTPKTLASFIADLDESCDGDGITLAIMLEALDKLFANVGRADAMHLLAAHNINANHPLVAAMVDAE